MTPESEAVAAITFALGVAALTLVWCWLVSQWSAWRDARAERLWQAHLSVVAQKRKAWAIDSIMPGPDKD